MTEPDFSISIRQDLRPSYYDAFHCLAAGCKLSCCKGWKITFDKKDYLALRRQTGSPELQKRLQGMHRVRRINAGEKIYGEFTMENSVCALLRDDCLCALQVECGPEALPEVCKTFPRTESYLPSGYLERSLTPACEGVLSLLWDLPEGLNFLSDPLPKSRERTVTMKKDSLAPFFQPIRELCIDMLQNRQVPLPQRILLMGMALEGLAGGEADIPAWLERSKTLPQTSTEHLTSNETDRTLALFLSNNIRTLLLLRSMDTDFAVLRAGILAALGIQAAPQMTVSLAPYCAARKRYQELFNRRDYFMENLMTALFFHLHLPDAGSREGLWKSYVNFCNLYSFYRFMAVMSCREDSPGDRTELFRALVFASRSLIHNGSQQSFLRDEFFQNDSATLAHMAILLGG